MTPLKDLGTWTFCSWIDGWNREHIKQHVEIWPSVPSLTKERKSLTDFGLETPHRSSCPKWPKLEMTLQETHVSLLLILTQSEKHFGMVLTRLQDLFHLKCSLDHTAEQCCCVSLFHWLSSRNCHFFYLRTGLESRISLCYARDSSGWWQNSQYKNSNKNWNRSCWHLASIGQSTFKKHILQTNIYFSAWHRKELSPHALAIGGLKTDKTRVTR